MEKKFEDFSKNRNLNRTSKAINAPRVYRESMIILPKLKNNNGSENSENHSIPKIYNGRNSLIQEDQDILKWHAWALILLCSILASAFSPLMISLDEPVFYKLFWNSVLLTIMLLLLSLKLKDTRSPSDQVSLLEMETIKQLIVPSLCYSVWIFCIVYSAHFNNMSHVLVFSNCAGLFIVVYRILYSTDHVTWNEKAGFLVSILGILLVLTDPTPLTYENSAYNFFEIPLWKRMLFGNFIALVGSGFAAIFVVKSKENLYRMTVQQKSTFFAGIGIPLFLVLSIVKGDFEEETTEGSIYDIFSPKVFIMMLLISAISGFAINYLLLKITEYFSEIGTAIAMQIQPIFGSIIVFLLGQQNLPSWLTFFGMCCCIPGLVLIKMEQQYDDVLSINLGEDAMNARLSLTETHVKRMESKELLLIQEAPLNNNKIFDYLEQFW